jgi:hypothetical protein
MFNKEAAKKKFNTVKEAAATKFGSKNEEPPIVQATYANDPTPVPYASNDPAPVVSHPVAVSTTAVPVGNLDTGDSFRNSEKQQKKKCNDWPFALLFFVNIIVISIVAGSLGANALNDELQKEQSHDTNFKGFIKGAVVCGCFGLALSAAMLFILIKLARTMIKVSLITSVIFAGLWMIAAFSAKIYGAAVFALIMFALSCCYACAVWGRIPFATANLVTACKAVNSNCGINVVAYFLVALAFAWSMLWTVALTGVWDSTYTCVDKTKKDGTVRKECSVGNGGYLFLILLSYFFTHQVLQNTLHATVAGVVGTWWFVPKEGKGCCSSAVLGSWYRSSTSSLGSICLGSLLVAIIQSLKTLARSAREEEGGLVYCLVECCLQCLQDILEYFNKWAFVYVGLYGYSYIEAGKNVMKLFEDRGWEAVIADDLVGNTLTLSSLMVGGLTGCCGLILNSNVDWFEDNGSKNATIAFIIGFVVGLVLCSILLSVIGSAVNAVIVCFADGPREFEQNYPELSQKMRTAWAEIYPDVQV